MRDEGFTDQTNLNLCKQCYDCIFWDMGETWCAPDKGECRIYNPAKGYMVKPDEIMNDEIPCIHRKLLLNDPVHPKKKGEKQ